MVSFLQVFLLIRLNHQLMHDNDIAIGKWFGRLQAEFHNSTATLKDFDQSSRARDAIDAVVEGRTWYLEITELDELLILVF